MTPIINNQMTSKHLSEHNISTSSHKSVPKSVFMSTSSVSVSDKDYGTSELTEIAMGTDARIDDPELLTTKKHLMLKGQTPLSLINALMSKWKRGGKLIDLSKCSEFKTAGQSMFKFEIGIPGVLTGEATDTTKQKAKTQAA